MTRVDAHLRHVEINQTQPLLPNAICYASIMNGYCYLACTGKGELFCMGINFFGRLGTKYTNTYYSNTQLNEWTGKVHALVDANSKPVEFAKCHANYFQSLVTSSMLLAAALQSRGWTSV